jgi:hypothetical protein
VGDNFASDFIPCTSFSIFRTSPNPGGLKSKPFKVNFALEFLDTHDNKNATLESELGIAFFV